MTISLGKFLLFASLLGLVATARYGKEISRHTGFFPQDEVERVLKGMGTQ